MPTKPTEEVINSYDSLKDPNAFGHDALESVINGIPQLRDALLDAGLVEECKKKEGVSNG